MSNAAQLAALLDDVAEYEMTEIAKLRAPSEACGLLVDVPPPGRRSRCIELPNRSLEHQDSALIHTTDIRQALSGWEGNWAAIWHSHPSGNIGPSRGDMQARSRSMPDLGYLVLTIVSDSETVVTWY